MGRKKRKNPPPLSLTYPPCQWRSPCLLHFCRTLTKQRESRRSLIDLHCFCRISGGFCLTARRAAVRLDLACSRDATYLLSTGCARNLYLCCFVFFLPAYFPRGRRAAVSGGPGPCPGPCPDPDGPSDRKVSLADGETSRIPADKTTPLFSSSPQRVIKCEDIHGDRTRRGGANHSSGDDVTRVRSANQQAPSVPCPPLLPSSSSSRGTLHSNPFACRHFSPRRGEPISSEYYITICRCDPE